MSKYFLLFFFILMILAGNAQRRQGSWKDYFSYSEAFKVAVAPDKIYCATTGGLFFYDLQDNSVNKSTDFAELSDFGIKTIAYSSNANVLVVAYNNSNLDLISEGKIVNMSDIKRKQLSTDKTINNISFINNEAWLSCGFGIVVVNLNKKEVSDTYLVGEGGSFLNINDVDAYGDYIYAATDKGILRALKNSNLLDYQNWVAVKDVPHSTEKFNHLAVHAGKFIANYTPEQWDQDQLYSFNGNAWETYLPQIRFSYDLQPGSKYLAATSREQIFIIDENHQIVKEVKSYQFGNENVTPITPRSAVVSDNASVWIADFKNTLVKINGNQTEQIRLNSPLDNSIFSLYQTGTDLWVSPGGTKGWELPHFQRFSNNQWSYFTKSNNPELSDFFNILTVTADPSDNNHIFVGSWGGGLLEYRNDKFVVRYTNKNSPLETALPNQPDEPFVRIYGIDFDSEGNLWVSNSEVAHNLHRLTADGKWTSFYLPEVANKYNIGPVLVNRNDDKWVVVLSGHDAYVVNKTGEKIKRLLVTSYFNNGQNEIFNRMNDIYSIAEDNDGAIWLGTSKGVAVYTNPSRIWESNEFYAMQPSLELNDGLYHPLLDNETVTAIAVDGANQKWLGTLNSGVYLVSENGTSEVLHFTTDNSLLPSNAINALAINQKNGEVFIGTDKGLVSYMGEATQGADSYDSVYVYPNPIRETYDGPITITNLIENSEVKITDIAGNLVFRTTSLGGQAVWDGRNLNGNRVKTGVYLVLCNDENGELGHISKLLFIH